MAISETSKKLYEIMVGKGYPKDYSRLIASELNTDFTAGRMIGYVLAQDRISLENTADEMLAIISDRDRIAQKHITEHAQMKINEMYLRNESNDDERDEDEN